MEPQARQRIGLIGVGTCVVLAVLTAVLPGRRSLQPL